MPQFRGSGVWNHDLLIERGKDGHLADEHQIIEWCGIGHDQH
jgi:hypothetical protein